MNKNIMQKGIIILIILTFIMPNIFADWVIPAQGEPGVLIMDENGYAHWGNLQLTESTEQAAIVNERIHLIIGVSIVMGMIFILFLTLYKKGGFFIPVTFLLSAALTFSLIGIAGTVIAQVMIVGFIFLGLAIASLGKIFNKIENTKEGF